LAALSVAMRQNGARETIFALMRRQAISETATAVVTADEAQSAEFWKSV